MLALLEEVLREVGFHLEVLDILESIAHRVEEHEEPVILCDEVIGHSDGEALFREVRSASNGRNAGFLLLGEDADGARIKRCLDAGIDEFVLKPFDVDELVARIHKVMRLQELRAQAHVMSSGEERIGFRGELQFMGLADLLMNLGQNARTGKLYITVEDGDYIFSFKRGELVAIAGPRGLKSRKALFRSLRIHDGQFRFAVTDDVPKSRGKFDNLPNIILQAVQEADEFPLYRDKLPPDPTPVSLTKKVDDVTLEAGNAVQPLLEGLIKSTTIDILIHACPRTDLTAARELQELMEKDVLVAIDASERAS